MITIITAVVVVLSARWVYHDATKHKIGEVKGAPAPNMSAGWWATITLFMWIIGFPWYLIKRRTLIERARLTPVTVGSTGRIVKSTALAVIAGVVVLLAVFNASLPGPPQLPSCYNQRVTTTVADIVNDMPWFQRLKTEFVSLGNVIEQGYSESKQIRACHAALVTSDGVLTAQYTVTWAGPERKQFYVEARVW